MNNVFAHYVYGIPVDETELKVEYVAAIRLATAWPDPDFEPDPDPEMYRSEREMLRAAHNLMDNLRRKLLPTVDAPMDLICFHVVGDDCYEGSDMEAGDLLLGIGVLAFPATAIKYPEVINRFMSAGADWHIWVTR